jgi:hypothetical protein
MIQVGDIIKTSYGTGPFVVLSVLRGCTCAEFVRRINGDDSPSEPHMHADLMDMNGRKGYGIGGYDDTVEPARNVWRNDTVSVIGIYEPEPEAGQLALF